MKVFHRSEVMLVKPCCCWLALALFNLWLYLLWGIIVLETFGSSLKCSLGLELKKCRWMFTVIFHPEIHFRMIWFSCSYYLAVQKIVFFVCFVLMHLEEGNWCEGLFLRFQGLDAHQWYNWLLVTQGAQVIIPAASVASCLLVFG